VERGLRASEWEAARELASLFSEGKRKPSEDRSPRLARPPGFITCSRTRFPALSFEAPKQLVFQEPGAVIVHVVKTYNMENLADRIGGGEGRLKQRAIGCFRLKLDCLVVFLRAVARITRIIGQGFCRPIVAEALPSTEYHKGSHQDQGSSGRRGENCNGRRRSACRTKSRRRSWYVGDGVRYGGGWEGREKRVSTSMIKQTYFQVSGNDGTHLSTRGWHYSLQPTL
jgi:hypothetical protein